MLDKFGCYLALDGFFDEGGHWHDNLPGLIDGNPGTGYDAIELDPYAEPMKDDLEANKQSLLMDEAKSALASLLTLGSCADT